MIASSHFQMDMTRLSASEGTLLEGKQKIEISKTVNCLLGNRLSCVFQVGYCSPKPAVLFFFLFFFSLSFFFVFNNYFWLLLAEQTEAIWRRKAARSNCPNDSQAAHDCAAWRGNIGFRHWFGLSCLYNPVVHHRILICSYICALLFTFCF